MKLSPGGRYLILQADPGERLLDLAAVPGAWRPGEAETPASRASRLCRVADSAMKEGRPTEAAGYYAFALRNAPDDEACLAGYERAISGSERNSKAHYDAMASQYPGTTPIGNDGAAPAMLPSSGSDAESWRRRAAWEQRNMGGVSDRTNQGVERTR